MSSFRLNVTYRLTNLGLEPKRPINSLDVAEIRPAFRRLRFSAGTAFEFNDDPTFRLEPVESAEGEDGPQEYTVITEPDSKRLRVTPSVFIDWIHPLGTSRGVIGLTGGIGIPYSDLRQIDDRTALSALFTIGYDGLLFSAGVASIAKTVGLVGDKGSSPITDPNILNDPRTTRDARFLFSVHYVF